MAQPTSLSAFAAVVNHTLEPIFDQFLDIQQQHLERLEQALADGDQQTTLRLAHTIKGACATYQLPVAAALAARLETSAKSGRIPQSLDIIASLGRYLRRVQVTFAD